MNLSPTSHDETKTASFQMKGSLFTLTVLQLIDAEPALFSAQLTAMVTQAPKFFSNAPVVIDLHRLLNPKSFLDIQWIQSELRLHGLIPVGVRGGLPEHHEAALKIGLASLPEAKSEVTQQSPKAANALKASPITVIQTTKVITQQVRSGQQIYAKGGDLIVLAAVSPGAELLADGHIHVYAPLRGRALAGVTGDHNARIFCQSLDAELVSIAGHYWVKEDLKRSIEHQAVQIYLEEERLKISYLNGMHKEDSK